MWPMAQHYQGDCISCKRMLGLLMGPKNIVAIINNEVTVLTCWLSKAVFHYTVKHIYTVEVFNMIPA